MKREKAFDCVAMKEAIQERLASKHAGMTPAERWRAVEDWLATSDDLVARKWRSLNPVPADAGHSAASKSPPQGS